MACWWLALTSMPIGDATTIFLTSPVWAALLARALLGAQDQRLHAFEAGRLEALLRDRPGQLPREPAQLDRYEQLLEQRLELLRLLRVLQTR